MSYHIDTAKDGSPSLYRSENGRSTRIHSAYSPAQEAERAVTAFSPGRAGIILVLGAGLGYHVSALRTRFPDRFIAVFDPDAEVIALCRQHVPDALNGIFVRTAIDGVNDLIDTVGIEQFRGYAVFTHRPSYALDRDFYDTVVAEAARYAASKMSDLLTRFEFQERWVENIIMNSVLIESSRRAAIFTGRFKGLPGVIVSAGPSLRHALPCIRELVNRALVICVDTAFPVLARCGITPHFVMTLDAQKHSIKHFIGRDPAGSLLLCDIVSSPDITHRTQSERVFATTARYYTDEHGAEQRETTPFADIIEEICGPLGDIQSGGSVATSAFDFLLSAGCSSIILAGQDLAYTGREIHSTGTHHNDSWLPITNRFTSLDSINQQVIRKRRIRVLEDECGGHVISDYVMNLYREWFVDAARRVPIPVYNLESRGARIENTVTVTAADLLRLLPAPRKKPSDIIDDIRSTATPDAAGRIPAFLHGALSLLEDAPTDTIAALENPERARLVSAYMKKSMTYIARHPEIDADKRRALLSADFSRAAVRMKRTISRALQYARIRGDGDTWTHLSGSSAAN